jgi:hypothetical protein
MALLNLFFTHTTASDREAAAAAAQRPAAQCLHSLQRGQIKSGSRRSESACKPLLNDRPVFAHEKITQFIVQTSISEIISNRA